MPYCLKGLNYEKYTLIDHFDQPMLRIRVPSFVSWPDRIKAGQVTDFIGHSNDLLPTICAMAGATIPAEASIDGINLLPILEGQRALPERGPLFWASTGYGKPQRTVGVLLTIMQVVREGRWKLAANKKGEPIALFDMDEDSREQTNLINHPEHAKRIRKLHAKLKSHLKEPSLPTPKALKGKK